VLSQVIVLSVVPLRRIPPPLAVTLVGDATEPNSNSISSTEVTVELIVVVVPFTVKLPVITVFALLIVSVPVAAPIEIVVAAPPIFNVVTVELNREAVVLVVAIAGDAPLMLRAVALANVTVEY